LRLFVS